MIIRIGIVAGEIWQLLEARGSMSLKDITSSINKDEALILMSLGWLSREGHIVLKEEGGDFTVSLRERQREEIKP